MSANHYAKRAMIEIDALTHPKLHGLLAYWRACAEAPGLPSRAAIDPLEMKEWLGNLLLIDVDEAGGFRYRLYGTQFVAEFGCEMTGRPIDVLPTEYRDLLRSEYETACATRAPTARRYTARFDWLLPGGEPHGARLVTWERLVLPLARDGRTVDMLLVGAYPIAEASDPAPADDA